MARILVRRGLLDEAQLQLVAEQANGRGIGQVAVEMGLVAETDVLRALADELSMPCVELKGREIDRELLAQFPTTVIFRHELLPLERNNGWVDVATSDPFQSESLDELSSICGMPIRPVLARRDEILESIKQHLGVSGGTINELVALQSEGDVELLEDLSEESGELAELAQTASVIRLVNELLIEALGQHSSDVHIEPNERGLSVRFRVDGLLQPQPVPSEINQFYSAIVTRLKIMSHLNIAEKRLPQDGRTKVRVSGREIDIRVSIIPMLYGEGVVLRLLDKSRMVFDLVGMGMPEDVMHRFEELISLPHGILLVTGPTGSGKTTTLYSALNRIKNPTMKIVTIEDPVEYHTEGISQIQVHGKIGLSFATGLRSTLRHDPDVILIGEIRDGETAQSAIQASLTGHLVFSTLHTNDAAGAFTRLVDMGVEPYLVASTVEGVLSQRLIRVLCPRCKGAYEFAAEDRPPDFPPDHAGPIFKPVGCHDCNETGYAGRTGVHELLPTDPTVRRLCVERADSNQIRDHAVGDGMRTLRDCGWRKVIDGLTSVEEVLRITKGM